MSGTLFIVTIPQKNYEDQLKKRRPSVIVIDKNQDGNYEEIPVKRKISTESYLKIDHDNLAYAKCRSTEGLNSTVNVSPLVKASSENPLNVSESFRSSWDGLKQALKPKRSKLKITGDGVDILSAFHWDTPLETILSEILTRVNVKNSSWCPTNEHQFWQVTFTIESGNLSEELLQVLKTFGIGSKFDSTVCMLPCALFYKSDCDTASKRQNKRHLKETAWNKFSSSVRARNNLAQILNGVRAEAALTFDWIFLLVVAAFVAAIGLVENSTVFLVASMLISPLMGPITASTLGTAVKDRSLQLMGVAHELLGLFMAMVIGFIFGLVICAVDEHYGVGEWPTDEILSRCEMRSLWVGALVAIPSGAAVALAILGEYTSSLVGVAISASLLPPAVNAGLLWAMSVVHLIYNDDDTQWNGVIKTPVYSKHQPTELAILGLISLCLTLVNIISIFLAGVGVYKVKEVCPLDRKNMSWWRDTDLAGTSQLNRFDNWNNHKYRRWCTKKDEPPKKHSVQADTVTFRKPSQFSEKLKAQEVEFFGEDNKTLNQNTTKEHEASYDSIQTALQNSESEENVCNKTVEDIKELNHLGKIAQLMRIKGLKRRSLDISRTNDALFDNFGFLSLGHVRSMSPEEFTALPTIEPSCNVTLEPKHGVLLCKKTYNV